MRVRIEFSGAAFDPGDEYQHRCSIEVDGRTVATGANLSDCPEDANLGRDLRFIYNLPNVLRRAWEAGKAGEAFDYEEAQNID